MLAYTLARVALTTPFVMMSFVGLAPTSMTFDLANHRSFKIAMYTESTEDLGTRVEFSRDSDVERLGACRIIGTSPKRRTRSKYVYALKNLASPSISFLRVLVSAGSTLFSI